MNTSFTPSINTLLTRTLLAIICVLLFSTQIWARTFTSISPGGPWSSSSTWAVSSGQPGVPTSNDDVIIPAGHTVSITTTETIRSLTLTGNLDINIPNGTLKTTDVIPNPSATTGNINITAGNFRVEDDFALTNLLITVTGGSSTVTFGGSKDFVRTNEFLRLKNGGKLIMENIGKGQNPKRQYKNDLDLGDILFPVGTTNGTSYSYTPVYINNRDNRQATVNATIAVTVADGVYSNGSDGIKYTSQVVNKSWLVSVLSGDANLEIYLRWNSADELSNFNPANSMVALYENNVWDLTSPTSIIPASRIASLTGVFTNIVTGQTSQPKSFPLLSIQGSGINPLPVELIAFNAVKNNFNVALTWETASEKNCKGFEIQSSPDGKNYEALAFIASQNGNASYGQRYAYTDRIGKREGLMYYRLKQTDLDGTVAYSQVKVVDLGRYNYTATVYPNPFQDAFKLNLDAQNAQIATVLITDITGKTLYTTEFNLAKGANNLDINLKDQTPGVYLLKVTTGSQTYTNRLVKQ